MNKRIEWIDVAKGICILSVIAGHLGQENINKIVFSYHITVFFILSGYTLKKSVLNKEYIEKKFKSLMLPYFLTCFAVICMKIINSIILDHDASVLTITNIMSKELLIDFYASGSITNLGELDLGGRIGAIWFLPALFFAVIISQVILKSKLSDEKQFLISILLSVVATISGRFFWLPFSVQAGMYALPFVLLGFFFRKYNALEKIRKSYIVVFLLIFIVGIILDVSAIYFVTANSKSYIFSFVCGLASSLLIIKLSVKLQKCKLLGWIGRNSIYFLCVHLFQLNTMGEWINKILVKIHLRKIWWNYFILDLCFIFIVVYGLKLINATITKFRIEKTTDREIISKRDIGIDIEKAILIVLMLVGHFTIDHTFRSIIYSFHMVAFIVLSGYFYRPIQNGCLKLSLVKLVKSFLVPYFVWGIFYIVLSNDFLLNKIRNVVFGMSFSNKIFVSCGSVGPVYFILLLFVVRIICVFIDYYIKNDYLKIMVIFSISFAGYYLGKIGLWLPWSIDVAMYSIVYYYIGYYLKKYRIFDYFLQRKYLYFILTIVWVYMIYMGSMEIAIRKYLDYGIVILGAVSATILIYILSKKIEEVLLGNIKNIIAKIGEYTLYILIIHTLLNGYIYTYIAKYLGAGYIFHMFLVIAIQLLLGLGAGCFVSWLKLRMVKVTDKT